MLDLPAAVVEVIADVSINEIVRHRSGVCFVCLGTHHPVSMAKVDHAA
jgi:hypothetical protein